MGSEMCIRDRVAGTTGMQDTASMRQSRAKRPADTPSNTTAMTTDGHSQFTSLSSGDNPAQPRPATWEQQDTPQRPHATAGCQLGTAIAYRSTIFLSLFILFVLLTTRI